MLIGVPIWKHFELPVCLSLQRVFVFDFPKDMGQTMRDLYSY